MANEKYAEVKALSAEDLTNELAVAENQLQKLSFQHAVKGLANPNELRETRKTIARVKTEIRQRELATFSEAELAQRSKIRARRRK